MRKLNRPTDQRMSVIKKLATDLLWYGKVETTVPKAKEVRSYVEKILTLAINTYTDTVKVNKNTVDAKGVTTQREVINDGVNKLAARRTIMSRLYDIQEVRANKESKASFVARTKDINHPLIEKIFNEYAPKYAKRAEELKIGGGYTRIIKLSTRVGDCAETALIELI